MDRDVERDVPETRGADEDRGVVLERLRARVRGSARPGESVVDELIAERRAQA